MHQKKVFILIAGREEWPPRNFSSANIFIGCTMNFRHKRSLKTSSAGSATLGDTGWARMINQLGPSNTKKTICGFILQTGTSQIFLFASNPRQSQVWQGGGTPHRTYILEGGDTAHTLLRWRHCTYLIGVGTPHMPYWGGDTAHSLMGWGHCTTLKEV